MYFLKEKINSKLLEAIITLSNGKEITVSKLIELYNDRWITVHPPKGDKSDKGVPVQIDEQRTIQKGLGGKHTGKKISQIRKTSKQEPSKEPTKEPQKETAPASENPYDTEEKRKKIKDEYQKALNAWYAITDKIKAERFELLKDNPRFLELEDNYLKGDNEAYSEYKRMIDEATEKIKEKYKDEYQKAYEEVSELQKHKAAVDIYELKEKRRIDREREEKAKTEAAETRKKAIQIAKDNYTPKSIAGVSKGKDMSFSEADNGHVNPNYKKPNEPGYDKGYANNCQSCVVCLEMRRRGYNVKTKKYIKGGVFSELGKHCSSAWLDKETGEIAVTTKLKAKNAKDLHSQLEHIMKEGERYNFEFWWKGKSSGHIVSMYKENGVVVWYDPQPNKTYKDKALLEKLETISLRKPVEILRIDNKSFNPYYIDKIVEKNA